MFRYGIVYLLGGGDMGEVSRLGLRLHRLRERAGLTQAELSERSGVARSIIANLERGARSNMTLGNAMRLADALGVSLDLLARGDVLDSETTPALV